MRQLILMRGSPAAGKSTLIDELGLRPYTIEPDAIRLMVQAPFTKIDGDVGISQANDKFVWDLLFKMLEQRMKNGDLTVIDATHSRTQLINRYRDLCKEYRYRVTVVDFSDIPLEVLLERNAKRDNYKFVPEEHIKSIYHRLQIDAPGGWVKTIHHKEFKQNFNSYITIKTVNLDKYKEIKVIGDIHGCSDALTKAIPEIKEDTMYIFLGDYFDRGVQNVQVFEILKEIRELSNVCLLEGNHETNLRKHLLNEDRVSKGTRLTINEFYEAGYTDKDIKQFYDSLSQLMYFSYNGTDYLCTHGGVPVLPTQLTSTYDIVCGVGAYEDDIKVNCSFYKENPNIIQIHGHRNTFNVDSTLNSYNLCGKVEFGETLKVLSITDKGCKLLQYKQDTINPNLVKSVPNIKASIPEEGLLVDFKRHKEIRVKEVKPNVFAVNFTSRLFKSRAWCELSLKARGLFIDKDSKIVARSWNKYFNYKEMPETSASALQEKLVYPVSVYEKYNGFLGILSVHNDEWFIASKSSVDGDFADMFKELITPYLTDKLKAYITATNVTMLFEVNHLNDKHIVEYSESHIVLLDVVFNDFETKTLNYEQLQHIAMLNNFRVKKLVTTLNSYLEWRDFRVKEKAKSVFDTDTEGYVLQDNNGFMFKLKSNYYSFWKRMRGLVQSIIKNPGNLPTIKSRLHSAEDFEVYNYIVGTIGVSNLDGVHIIDIRNKFMASK